MNIGTIEFCIETCSISEFLYMYVSIFCCIELWTTSKFYFYYNFLVKAALVFMSGEHCEHLNGNTAGPLNSTVSCMKYTCVSAYSINDQRKESLRLILLLNLTSYAWSRTSRPKLYDLHLLGLKDFTGYDYWSQALI